MTAVEEVAAFWPVILAAVVLVVGGGLVLVALACEGFVQSYAAVAAPWMASRDRSRPT